MIYSTHESFYHRHWQMIKMGCILDEVLVLLVRCPLGKHRPLAWQPVGGAGHALQAGCGRKDKHLTLGQMALIKACVAHLTVHRACLDYDFSFKQQNKESGKMAARNLPINVAQHREVMAGIYMVKLVNGIPRHKGSGHWVEMCDPPPHFLGVYFFSVDPPRRCRTGNLLQSPRRGHALRSDMKSKHHAMAGPWAFFLTMALWGIRGYRVLGPLRQEPDIACPPGNPSYPPCRTPPALQAWGI